MSLCSRMVVGTCIASLSLSASIYAAAPATLLGPDLHGESVTLQDVDDGVVRYFDDDRVLRQMRLDELVEVRFTPGDAVVPTTPAAHATAAGRAGELVLVDGQRYQGRYIGVDERGRLVIEHPRLGPLTATLAQLTALRFDGGDQVQPTEPVAADVTGLTVHDAVTMLNGDRLEGFVVAIGDEHLELEIAAGSLLSIPLERIAAVRFAAAAAADVALSGDGGHHLLLRDGSRVTGSALSLTGATLGVVLTDGRGVALPVSALAAVAVRGRAGTLVSLLDLPMTVEQPAVVFGVPWPATRSGEDGYDDQEEALYLHGPTTVRFDLPPGAARLTAMVELDLPTDHPQRWWGSVDVMFEQDEAVLAAMRLDADQLRTSLNVSVQAGALRIRLEEAQHGPVLDRVRLSEARVLVAP